MNEFWGARIGPWSSARASDYQGTLDLVMHMAAQTLPMGAGVLFLITESSHEFEVAASHNLTPQPTTPPAPAKQDC